MKNLDVENFKYEHLGELWSRYPINGNPVISTYVESIMMLYFQIFKIRHGNGLIAIHKFANTHLIYANVRIEVAVNHHEQLVLLNFYH